MNRIKLYPIIVFILFYTFNVFAIDTPSAPSVSITNNNGLILNWSPVPNASYYFRQVSVNGGPWSYTYRYTTTSITYGTQTARRYKFRVMACDANDVCSGYSSVSNEVEILPDTPKATASLSWIPSSINYNEVSTLRWSSTDATSCKLNGVDKGVNNTWSTRGTSTRTDIFLCEGKGGQSNTVSATLNVEPAHKPVASLSWTPAFVNQNEVSTLRWSSTSASSCKLNGVDKGTNNSWSTNGSYARTDTFVCEGVGGQSNVATAKLVVKSIVTRPAATTLSDNRIRLTWNPVADATHYFRQVSVNDGPWDYKYRYTQTDVTYSKQKARNYKFRVQACYADGSCANYSTPSNELRLLPKNPTATLLEGNGIRVQWDSELNATHYFRQASVDNGPWGYEYRYTETDISYGEQLPRKYRFRVKVCYGGSYCSDYSYPSNEVEVLPPKPTASINWTPENVKYGETAILKWDSTYASICRLNGVDKGIRNTLSIQGSLSRNDSFSCEGVSGQSKIVTATLTVIPAPKPVATLSWTPEYVNFGGAATLKWIGTDATNCKLNGITQEANSSMVIQAEKGRVDSLICDGPGGQSGTVKATLIVKEIVKKPTASVINDNGIRLTWNPVANATHYFRQVRVNKGPWSYTSRHEEEDVTYGKQKARNYEFRVKACFGDNSCTDYSEFSNELRILPKSPVATELEGNGIRVKWEPELNATHYFRQASVDNGPWGYEFKYTETDVSYGEQLPRRYRFRIKACYADGNCSDFSEPSNDIVIIKVEPTTPPVFIPNGGQIQAGYPIALKSNDPLIKYAILNKTGDCSGEFEWQTYLQPDGYILLDKSKRICAKAASSDGTESEIIFADFDIASERKIIFIHTDLLGSPVVETNDKGVVQ